MKKAARWAAIGVGGLIALGAIASGGGNDAVVAADTTTTLAPATTTTVATTTTTAAPVTTTTARPTTTAPELAFMDWFIVSLLQDDLPYYGKTTCDGFEVLYIDEMVDAFQSGAGDVLFTDDDVLVLMSMAMGGWCPESLEDLAAEVGMFYGLPTMARVTDRLNGITDAIGGR